MWSIKKKVLEIFSNKERKRLLTNFLSLTVLQGANYILPLLTFPYLFRVLGVEYFGLLAFATAVVNYFLILSDYGFNLSGTREISMNCNDPKKVSEIYSSVLIIKVFLVFFGLAILTSIVLIFDKFSSHRIVYFLTFGMVMGQSLFSTWFFQGIEDMKYVTILNIVGKLIFTIPIFIFVKVPSDYYLVPLLTSIGYIIIGICSLIIISYKFRVKFEMQPLGILRFYLKNSWHLFISNISVTLYTFSTILLLGFFTNNVVVGYYSAAERLVAAVRSIIGPISQTFYPFLNRKSLESKQFVIDFNKRFLSIGGSIMLIICIILFAFSHLIVITLFGLNAINSIIVLRIIAFVPFLILLDTVFATFTMLVFGKNASYSKIVLIAGIINIIIALILIPRFHHIGAAYSLLFSECFVTINLYLYVRKHKLFLFITPS